MHIFLSKITEVHLQSWSSAMDDQPTSPWAQWPELVIIAGHIGNLCCSEMAVLEVAWVLRTQQKLPNHQETEKHKTRNQFTKNKYKKNLKVNYRSLSSIQLLQPGKRRIIEDRKENNCILKVLLDASCLMDFAQLSTKASIQKDWKRVHNPCKSMQKWGHT